MLFALSDVLLHRGRGIVPKDIPRLIDRLDNNPKGIFMYDNVLAYRMKPNFVGRRYFADNLAHRTNSLGLVGAEEVDPDPAVRKVLFLGDSITYGVGYGEEDTFVDRLNAMVRPGTQVLNAGCYGWGTYQELLFFRDHLAQIAWFRVILVFCTNDLPKYVWVFDSDDSPRLASQLEVPGAGVIDRARLEAIRRSFSLRQETEPLSWQPNDFLLAWDRSGWKTYEMAVLDPLLERGIGAPKTVVAMPTFFQIESAVRGASPEVVFFPQKRLAEYCARNRIPFIDPSPEIIADPDRALLFHDPLGHLTPKGHEFMAKLLLGRLGFLTAGNR
jgi:lysophospholipase L1-like esterase